MAICAQALLTHYGTNKLKSLDVLSTGRTEHPWPDQARRISRVQRVQQGHEGQGHQQSNVGLRVHQRTPQGRRLGCNHSQLRGAAPPDVQDPPRLQNSKLLNLSQVPAFTLPKAPKPKKDFATKEEFDKLLKFLDAKFHPYATFLFYQATRKTEAASITWKEINIAEAMYYPDSEKNKTGDDAPKPLANEVVKMLRHVVKGRTPMISSSSRTFRRRCSKKAFRKACYEAGTWARCVEVRPVRNG